MKKKTRSILFILFIVLFLTISPLMIFYAFGFKFDISQMKLQKTGTFVITTEPKKAKIFLNNKLQINTFKNIYSNEEYIKTPTKIKNILPGEYEVRLELEGYWPWQKKLTINPGESVFIEDVFFFKKNSPLLILEKKEIQEISISNNKEKIAVLTNTELTILNAETNKTISAFPLKQTTANNKIIWANDDNKIILNNLLFNLTNNEYLDLNKLTKLNKINNIKWSNDDKTIYYQNNFQIYALNINNKINKKIITAKSNDYLVKNNDLYYTTNNDQKTILNIYEINNQKNIGQITLAKSKYTFINPANKWINLYDENNQKLHLVELMITTDNKYNHKEISNIKDNYWINNDKLLYTDDFEIRIWNSENNHNRLLTRISDKINKVIWHPNNNYIIYDTNKGISTLELDDREKHNVNTLLKSELISSPYLSKEGDRLLFYSTINNISGLYKLEI